MPTNPAPGVLSKGIKLEFKTSASGTTYTEITDMQEIPALGGTYDKQEVTTLADAAHRYINGLKSYDDLAFKFLYDNSGATSNYRVAKGVENVMKEYRVTFPDGTKFEFTGMSSVKIDGAGTNAPLMFTVTIALNSDISVTDPTT